MMSGFTVSMLVPKTEAENREKSYSKHRFKEAYEQLRTEDPQFLSQVVGRDQSVRDEKPISKVAAPAKKRKKPASNHLQKKITDYLPEEKNQVLTSSSSKQKYTQKEALATINQMWEDMMKSPPTQKVMSDQLADLWSRVFSSMKGDRESEQRLLKGMMRLRRKSDEIFIRKLGKHLRRLKKARSRVSSEASWRDRKAPDLGTRFSAVRPTTEREKRKNQEEMLRKQIEANYLADAVYMNKVSSGRVKKGKEMEGNNNRTRDLKRDGDTSSSTLLNSMERARDLIEHIPIDKRHHIRNLLTNIKKKPDVISWTMPKYELKIWDEVLAGTYLPEIINFLLLSPDETKDQKYLTGVGEVGEEIPLGTAHFLKALTEFYPESALANYTKFHPQQVERVREAAAVEELEESRKINTVEKMMREAGKIRRREFQPREASESLQEYMKQSDLLAEQDHREWPNTPRMQRVLDMSSVDEGAASSPRTPTRGKKRRHKKLRSPIATRSTKAQEPASPVPEEFHSPLESWETHKEQRR